MKKAKILLLAAAYLFLLFLSVCPGTDTARTAAPATLSPTEAGADSGRIPKAYIRAKGKQFVVGEDDTPIRLEGVCFGNEVWGNPLLPPTKHHNERDFLRVKEMKMNVIRFYLNYGLFEDDEEPYQYVEYGWEWLDKNVEWAKKHGIYLIFNMHVPQGGFQSHGEGMALWDDPEIQNRLVALWRAIAERYKDETIVAGYDLVNEPIARSPEDWEQLARRLVAAIREVDPYHLIIVERLHGVKGDWRTFQDLNFFLIEDPNIAYTFHFYHPFSYTHQNTPWTGMPEDSPYPDENTLIVPADTQWYTATFNNPTLPPGNSGWRYYRGQKYRATDPNLLTGKPAFVSRDNSGSAYFGDFVIEEYDENGNYLGNVCEGKISSLAGWHFWSEDGSGKIELAKGRRGGQAIKISGTTADTNAAGNDYRFAVTPGHSYAISGYMKGRRVSEDAICMLRIDFETSPSGKKLFRKNKEYLRYELEKFIEFRETHNVPLYLGEFGLYQDCFTEGRGGLNWVRDMLELLDEYDLSYTYHAYHEYSFGIYWDGSALPNEASANTGLIKLFRGR